MSCVEEVPNHPRVCVTWYEAQAYAHWRGGRLPTEAEWEYAARGPESLIYPWGDSFDATKANVVDSSGLVPVSSYPDGVSWVGAHDMAGNAMEWVKDWLDFDYYERRIRVDPQGPENGRIKIEKGGWWGSNPYVARAAYRHFEDPPTYQDHHIGFRIVTPAEAPREGLGRGVAERPSVQVRNVPPLIVWPWTSVPRRYGFESRAAARAHVIRQVIQIDRGAPTLLLAPAAG